MEKKLGTDEHDGLGESRTSDPRTRCQNKSPCGTTPPNFAVLYWPSTVYVVKCGEFAVRYTTSIRHPYCRPRSTVKCGEFAVRYTTSIRLPYYRPRSTVKYCENRNYRSFGNLLYFLLSSVLSEFTIICNLV